jgi:hypothetical protein
LANEIDVEVFEDFFSQNDERSQIFIEEYDGESPRYVREDRSRLNYSDLLAPPEGEKKSNTSSA